MPMTSSSFYYSPHTTTATTASTTNNTSPSFSHQHSNKRSNNRDEVEAGSILVALANHHNKNIKSMSIHNLLGKDKKSNLS